MQTARRSSLRAPVNDDFLYVFEDFVLKGECANISSGGVLLTHLSRVPSADSFSILLPLKEYPEFSKVSTQKVISLDRFGIEINIVRAEIEILRKFEGLSAVEKTMMTNIGASFKSLTSFDEKVINDFVKRFSVNLTHLLTLFENNDNKGENLVYLRKVASLLGYNGADTLPSLRQRVLHDYQSVKSL